MSYYRLSEAHNGVEIFFDAKPSAKVRESLKNQGFRWHQTGGYWFARQTAERIELAKSLTSCNELDELASCKRAARAASQSSYEGVDELELAKFTTKASNGYMGATELTGSEYAKGWLFGAGLSKAIREALKRCRVTGASVRAKTFSGGQEITVTLKASASDIVSESEYVSARADDISGYWFVTPTGEQIHRDAMPWGNGAKEIIDHTHKVQYNNAVRDMARWGLDIHGDGDGLFTTEFVKKIRATQQILDAFNHDDSNGMVDYFDRHFYDTITVKTA